MTTLIQKEHMSGLGLHFVDARVDLSALASFAQRRLAVLRNVLSPQSAQAMRAEALEFQSVAQKNAQMRHVHSGQLLQRPQALVHQFMSSPHLARLVSEVAGTELGVCPCANRQTYSLYKADFGCKLNFYEGDDPGIGWHYDKETSWEGPTYVVIYTIMLRRVEEDAVLPREHSDTPAVYDIFEGGRVKSFEIPENSLHIHDTRQVFHRAFVPQGYKRSALIMHFSTAPCRESRRVAGFSARLIAMNALGRLRLLEQDDRLVRCLAVLLLLLVFVKLVRR